MGKLTFGKAIRTINKISREIERENKRQEKERAQWEKQEKLRIKAEQREIESAKKERKRNQTRAKKEAEKEIKRQEKEAEEERKRQKKEAEKRKKEAEKLRVKKSAEAKKKFSKLTIKEHNLGKYYEGKLKLPTIKYDLNSELQIIKKENPNYLNQKRKIKGTDLDIFLYSGELNSVLGIEGINEFREEVLNFIGQQEGQIVIKFPRDKVLELVFKYGLFFEYECSNSKIRSLEDNLCWKSLHRIILVKSDYNSLKEICLDYLKSKHPKHFSEFSRESLENLQMVLEEVSTELSIKLEDFINKIYILQVVA